MRKVCTILNTRIVFYLSILLLSNLSVGQIKKLTVLSATPEEAVLVKFSDILVVNSTVISNISMPILKLVSKDIEMPIFIDYSVLGIKINELASFVGLGWALNAGVSICRSTIGMPDELINRESVPFPEQFVEPVEQIYSNFNVLFI